MLTHDSIKAAFQKQALGRRDDRVLQSRCAAPSEWPRLNPRDLSSALPGGFFEPSYTKV